MLTHIVEGFGVFFCCDTQLGFQLSPPRYTLAVLVSVDREKNIFH